jgi:predicted dehydrogenase
MKILIIGNSNIFNKKIYFALKKFKNIKLDIASKKKIRNVKVDRIYKSYSKALNSTTAKIVYVSLINSKHFYWASRALNKNKHVIVDKPLTTNFKDTKKLLTLARNKNLLLSESIVFHYHKQFKSIFSKINFKKPIKIIANFHVPKFNKNNFRNYSRFGGGCLQDMSAYACYLIYIFFKNKKYSLLSDKIIKNGYVNSFNVDAKSKNIILKASFSFNSTYKNEISIHNKSKIYQLNYFFSPPINKSLNALIHNAVTKKNYKINYKKQNVFHAYFDHLFKIIRNKKYNHFYKEIENVEKIKKKIIGN